MCLLSWKTMSLVHACIKIMLDFLFHSGIIKWELIVNIFSGKNDAELLCHFGPKFWPGPEGLCHPGPGLGGLGQPFVALWARAQNNLDL